VFGNVRCFGKSTVLVRDWHKDTQTKERIRSAMSEILDIRLPQSYGKDDFAEVRNKA
jgi:hypothetical protein